MANKFAIITKRLFPYGESIRVTYDASEERCVNYIKTQWMAEEVPSSNTAILVFKDYTGQQYFIRKISGDRISVPELTEVLLMM